jgi:HEAT repeat protein
MSTSVTIRRHRPCRKCRWELSAGILAAALLVAAPAQVQAQGDAAPATGPAAVAPAAGAPTAPPAATTPVPAKPGVAGKQKMTREEMIRLNPKIHPSAFARNYDELGVPDEIEKARKGDGEGLFVIISQIHRNPRLLPPRKQLPVFHEYLKDPSYLVQWLGVTAIERLKDKSSLKPLQDYIMAASERKPDPKALPRYEAIASGKAPQDALYALGEIGTDDSVTTKLLVALLKKDVPMEWGGGIAHQAIARKGREGLMILLKESETANGRQQSFINSAIGGIQDPALLPDFYAGCQKTCYSAMVRQSLVITITSMAKTSPAAEKMLIEMANNPALDIRWCAIDQLGRLGSENAVKALNDLRANTKDENVLAMIDNALMKCDAGQILYTQINRLMDEKTDYNERRRILRNIMGLDDKILNNHLDLLVNCLTLKHDGKPMNDERKEIWVRLYGMTGKIYDVEFDVNNETQYNNYISLNGICAQIRSKIRTRNRENKVFNMTEDQIEKIAENEIRPHVSKFLKKESDVVK